MTSESSPTQNSDGERSVAPELIRVSGRFMQAWFKTEVDLRPFVADKFALVDNHRAFIKVFDVKYGPTDRPFLPPAFSQYRQICVTVLAAPPGREPLHINLIMWEQRGWSMAGGGALWHKKMADIEMTALYPVEERYRDPAAPVPYIVDASSFGAPLMHFEGALDGIARREPIDLKGFYFGGRPGQPTYCLMLREPYLGPPWHGQGTLKFFRSPDEYDVPLAGDWRPSVLGEVEVEGFCLQDITFLRDYKDLETL